MTSHKRVIDGALFGLLFAFGLSSWGTVNFLFSEVPILAQRYPSIGRSVGTYISAAVAVTNAFAVGCVVVSHFLSGHAMRKLTTWLVGLVLVADLTSNVFFTWDPAPQSTLLFLIFTGVAGLGATLSSVAFLPFAARFPPVYTPSLTSGIAASAMLAGALALVQNPGTDDLFSFNIFIGISLTVTCGSIISFVLILTLPRFRHMETSQPQTSSGDPANSDAKNDGGSAGSNAKTVFVSVNNTYGNTSSLTSSSSTLPQSDPLPSDPLLPHKNDNTSTEERASQATTTTNERKRMLWGEIAKLFYLSFLENGIVMALSSYALIQYSNTAFVVANSVSAFSDPFVNLFPAMLSPAAAQVLDKPVVQAPTITVFSAAALYVLALAMTSNSETPFLSGSGSIALGAFVACVARVLVRIGTALIKVRALMVLHGAKRGGDDKKRMSLSQLGGLAMQIGTTLGSALSFVLVKVYVEKVHFS